MNEQTLKYSNDLGSDIYDQYFETTKSLNKFIYKYLYGTDSAFIRNCISVNIRERNNPKEALHAQIVQEQIHHRTPNYSKPSTPLPLKDSAPSGLNEIDRSSQIDTTSLIGNGSRNGEAVEQKSKKRGKLHPNFIKITSGGEIENAQNESDESSEEDKPLQSKQTHTLPHDKDKQRDKDAHHSNHSNHSNQRNQSNLNTIQSDNMKESHESNPNTRKTQRNNPHTLGNKSPNLDQNPSDDNELIITGN